MSGKGDKFNQAVDIYKTKYEMQVESILKFIRDKIDSPQEVLQNIEDSILSYQNRTDAITEEQLRNYFHLVAAVQAKVDVKEKELEQLGQYLMIKFRSSKSKEAKKKDTNTNQPAQAKSQEKKIDVPLKKEAIIAQQQVESPLVQEQKTDKKAQRKAEQRTVRQAQKKAQQKQAKSQAEVNPVRSPKKQKKEQKLGVIEQNVVEEDRSSNAIKVHTKSQQFFVRFPEAQMMKMRSSLKQVQIRGYDKFGQNYFNPIIKYRLVFQQKAIYRRYTQFQNLMRYLDKRYQGFILPELPPKEGIKSNLSYLWGVDQAFLNNRQNKLEEMMNTLMSSKFIRDDDLLIRFMSDQDYEIQSGDDNGTINYLRLLGEIAFNARELKSYGMAYYNYFKSFKKSDINTKVTDCYKEAESILSYFIALDSYRTTINSNFDKRREIFNELDVDLSDRTLTITEFDKLSAASAAEVRNLDKQMNKYYELKSEQSWLGYLIGQKEYEFDTSVEDLKKRHKDIQRRIVKMENNLMESIDGLVQRKTAFLEEIDSLILDWRRCIHP